MVAAFVLIAGVLFVLLIGFVLLAMMGLTRILSSLVPLAPGLVMVGSFLLILSECLLIFGNKQDRKDAMRDMCYLLPTFVISALLWYLAQSFLW